MPWEVEQIGACTLYRGDCREVLPTLGRVDVVVTDPPYGQEVSYASFKDDRDGHAERCGEWLWLMQQAAPVVCVFTSMRALHQWAPPDWIAVWHKDFSVGHSPFGANNWEPVAVYGKPGHNERQSDYFSATFRHRGATSHPCPKPIEAMVGAIQIARKPGQTICDPFMGIGTCGEACVRLGRRFIGIELDRGYWLEACCRIEDAYTQPDLFVPVPAPPEQLRLGV